MSKSETISKLEALLARIRSHAGEPRRSRAALAAASTRAPMGAPPAPPPPAPPVSELEEVDEVDEVTIPPPAMPAFRSPAATEVESVVEVEVVQEGSTDAVIGITADEVIVSESLGSRERLVAAEPVALEPFGGLSEPTSAPDAIEESPPELLAAVEEVDEVPDAPLSSRRPVAPQPEERLADMAFGAEEPRPPRHTPPPESGRLPAAPPVEFDGDVTGVREATPILPRSRELVPEATRVELVASDAVADVVEDAQRFAPPTFAALLDASLAL